MIEMSDSETDLLPNNILTFQNQGTTVCAKGPNINSTIISSLGFRSNTMTNMNMHYTDRPRYTESICDPRSMSYRREREVSPMSCRSASGLQPRNFHHYPGSSGSQRFMYNGRSGSPMSVKSSRTIDSNTSMSARDIAFAFQNGHFNNFDFKIIKEAYNKYMKSRHRRRVEKKRKIKMFLKGFRRRSGGDSGDQASNSSISSDEDCRRSLRSSRSTMYKDIINSCRSTRRDMSQFRREMRANDMVQDCTDNFRQNSIKNMLPVRPPSVKDTIQPRWQNTSVQNNRFKGNFLLPSQRYNQSVASTFSDRPSRLASICEDNMLETRSSDSIQNERPENKKSNQTDSEHDEIFGEKTVVEKNNNGKRVLEEDLPSSDSKRTKLNSPPKKSTKPKTPKKNQMNTSIKRKSSDFVFAKPQLPIKKTVGIVKNTQKIVNKASKPQHKATTRKSEEVQHPITSIQSTDMVDSNMMAHSGEKLISSSLKFQEILIAKSTLVLEPEQSSSRLTVVDEQEKDICPRAESTQFSTTDLSMRPSFIKRKLFSQKVDETAKNSSSDSLHADSPQNSIYSKIQKEKNRARKLATQSYLNRDVGDDSNLLDLIHKIVPPDRMNVTAVNRSELPNNKSKPTNKNDDKTDKWDVTSVISTCNNEDVSDTYTDEEIFAGDDDQNKVAKHIRDNQNKSKSRKSQKEKTEQQNKDKLGTIPVTEQQNIVVESKQGEKQSKNIVDKQTINKTAKQNITAVSKGDEKEAFKHGKAASESQPVVEKRTIVLPDKQTKTLPKKIDMTEKQENTENEPVVENQTKTLPKKIDKKLPEKQANTLPNKQQVNTENKPVVENQTKTLPKKIIKKLPEKQANTLPNKQQVNTENEPVVENQTKTLPDKQTKTLPKKIDKKLPEKQANTVSNKQQVFTENVVENQTKTLPDKLTKTLPKKTDKKLPGKQANTVPNKQVKPLPENKGRVLPETQAKTSTLKKKVCIQKQKSAVAPKQYANTASKQSKTEVEKQNKLVVDDKSAAPDKLSNLTQSQTTPPKFLVVMQRFTPHSEKEQSPTDRNGLVKANVFKGLKSFWDTDTESEIDATPMKRTAQMGQSDSRPLGAHAMVDTVIEDISSVSPYINSPNRKILNVTLEKLKVKTAPVTQKEIKDIEHTNKLSSNKKADIFSGKELSKASSKTTNERSPVKNAKHVNNRLKETTSSTKENQPPTNNRVIENASKPKSKLHTSQKSDNPKINDTLGSECRHLKVHNNTLRIRPQGARKAAGAARVGGRCCASPDTSGPAADDSSLYRSLRSRNVDLSTSLKAYDANDTRNTTKPAPKNKRVTKIISKDKAETTIPSDISFTLTSEPAAANRTLRSRRVTANIQKLTSDISFSLVSDKSCANDSISSRPSKRRREVDILQSNSESFFKTRKRSPLSKRIMPDNAANRSRSRR